MESIVYFEICKTCLAIRFSNTADEELLTQGLNAFRTNQPNGPLLFCATVNRTPYTLDSHAKLRAKFNCHTQHICFYSTAKELFFTLNQSDRTQTGIIQTDSNFNQVNISIQGNFIECQEALKNALMLIFAFAGIRQNIILLHAAAIIYNKKVYLFLGQSGIGKSTHAKLWLEHIPHTQLLNDDNPALKFTSNGEFTIYGTPWSGNNPCYHPLGLPLGASIRLEQANNNHIKQLKPLEAFDSFLSACSKPVFNSQAYQQIIQVIEVIAQTTPAYLLKCLPNRDAALLCQKTIAC